MSGNNNPSKREDVKQKISNALTGRKRSAEHNKNLQAALTPEIKKLRSQKIWETRRKNKSMELG